MSRYKVGMEMRFVVREVGGCEGYAARGGKHCIVLKGGTRLGAAQLEEGGEIGNCLAGGGALGQEHA